MSATWVLAPRRPATCPRRASHTDCLGADNRRAPAGRPPQRQDAIRRTPRLRSSRWAACCPSRLASRSRCRPAARRGSAAALRASRRGPASTVAAHGTRAGAPGPQRLAKCLWQRCHWPVAPPARPAPPRSLASALGSYSLSSFSWLSRRRAAPGAPAAWQVASVGAPVSAGAQARRRDRCPPAR